MIMENDFGHTFTQYFAIIIIAITNISLFYVCVVKSSKNHLIILAVQTRLNENIESSNFEFSYNLRSIVRSEIVRLVRVVLKVVLYVGATSLIYFGLSSYLKIASFISTILPCCFIFQCVNFHIHMRSIEIKLKKISAKLCVSSYKEIRDTLNQEIGNIAGILVLILMRLATLLVLLSLPVFISVNYGFLEIHEEKTFGVLIDARSTIHIGNKWSGPYETWSTTIKYGDETIISDINPRGLQINKPVRLWYKISRLGKEKYFYAITEPAEKVAQLYTWKTEICLMILLSIIVNCFRLNRR